MRLTLFATLALAAMSTALVGAHGEQNHPAADPRVLSAWDQATLLGLAVMAALYWAGTRRLKAL